MTQLEDPGVAELLYPDLGELEDWLGTPAAPRTHTLQLRGAYPPIAPILRRLADARLPALRRLALDGCQLGAGGVDLLLGSGLLRRLDGLTLIDETLDEEAVAALFARRHLAHLEQLHLEAGPAAVHALITCPDLGGLRSLGVSPYTNDLDLAALLRAPFRPEALAPWYALARARVAEQLRRRPLRERWEASTGPLLAALVNQKHVPGDMSIDIGSVPGDRSAEHLGDTARTRWPASARPALSAWLDDALRGPAPALGLAGTLQLYRLRGSRRVAEDLGALTTLLAHPDARMRRVDLSSLSLDEPTLARWLAAPWLAGVFALDLHGHRLGPAAASRRHQRGL